MVKDRYFHDLLPAAARRQRHIAALSTLRRILADSGLRTVSVPAAYSTTTCSWCGAADRLWEHRGELYHTCPHCGRTWDRDINAVRNLLRRYLEAQTPQHT
jgi:transposase